jgi:hypothetical protein
MTNRPNASSLADTFHECSKCGAIGEVRQGPGAGPHFGRLECGGCGAFIRWLPCPPTDTQLRYLAVLGYRDAPPVSKKDAFRIIRRILEEGVRHD